MISASKCRRLNSVGRFRCINRRVSDPLKPVCNTSRHSGEFGSAAFALWAAEVWLISYTQWTSAEGLNPGQAELPWQRARGAAHPLACILSPAIFVLGATPAAERRPGGGSNMTQLFAIALAAGTLSFGPAVYAQTAGTVGNAGAAAADAKNTQTGCAACE